MSYELTKWATDIEGLDIYQRGVLQQFCARANQEGECFPSQSKMAIKLNISRTKVNLVVQELIALGIISKTKDNLYIVTPVNVVNSSVHVVNSKPVNEVNNPVNTINTPVNVVNSHLNKPINKPINKDKKRELNFDKFFKIVLEISSFNIFYSRYPRKKNPNQAFKTFQKLNGKAKLSQILAKVEMHKTEIAKNKTEERFIQHPSTWLNENNFDDMIAVQKPQNQTQDIEAALARYDKGQPWRFEQFNMTEAQARALVDAKKHNAVKAAI